MFEAVVKTNEGIYRAYHDDLLSLSIVQDGIGGVIDTISFKTYPYTLVAPELLLHALLTWVYEMRREETVINTSLNRRI